MGRIILLRLKGFLADFNYKERKEKEDG